MAEKGLFFNAFPDDAYETGYDRNYSADDISDWLSIVCENGVVKSDNEAGTGIPQGLKVVAAEGMNVSINVGKATIRGKGYINDSLLTLPIATAPTGTTPRYDMVVLRQDNTQSVDARKNYVLIASVDHLPTINDLTRNSDIYDLLLGYITVQPNATSIQQTYITDTRGDEELCPWFTAVKGYDDYYDAIIQRFEYDTTLSGSASFVVTNLPSSLYNDKYSLINVYVNGLKEESTNYTIDATNQYIKITFTSSKNTGANISVVLNNFVDGEGLSSAIEDYNQWVQDVADLESLKEFNYYCNGTNDNVMLCSLVNQHLAAGKNIKVNVIGQFGITAAYSGSGTNTNPYRFFEFQTQYNARYTLDFSNCSAINYIVDSGTINVIFTRGGGRIIGARVNFTNTASGTYIQAFSNDGPWLVEGCEFNLEGYNMTYISQVGTFYNCKGSVKNTYGYSYCFYPKANALIVVNGGEYKAYVQDNNKKSAIVGQTTSGSTIVLINVNAPTVAESGYYQTNSLYQTAGRLSCFGLISALTIDSPSSTILCTLSTSIPNQSW